MATLKDVLDKAAAGGYGVGAFNVNNMETKRIVAERMVQFGQAGHA